MSEGSTTPDLVELTRRVYEYASVRDWDSAMTLYSPTSIWDTSAMGLGVYEGPAILAFFEDWGNAYQEYEIEIEDVLDVGNGIVFSEVRVNGRLPGSAGYVHQHYAAVMTWADGLIERVANYLDIDEARAAAERLAESRE